MKNLRGRKLVLACISVALWSAGCSTDPLTSAFTSAYSGKKAKEVVDRAGQQGREIVAQAESSGSAVATRVGSELQLAAQVASRLLGEQLGQNVERLSAENARLLARLDQLTDTANHFVPDAYRLKDSTVLDLEALFGDTWFAKSHDFIVQRIDGITLMERPMGGDYRLDITGIGFGTDQDDLKGKVEAITLAGKTVIFRENKPRRHLSEITIPGDQVKPYFQKTALNVIPVHLSVQVSRRKGGTWPASKYGADFYISLLPKVGGIAKIAITSVKKDWVTDQEKKVYPYRSPDHHQEDDIRHFVYVDQQRLDEGYRFAEPKNSSSSGEGCPWTDGGTVSIPDPRTLLLTVEVWGSPCAWSYWAKIEKLAPVGEKTETKDVLMYYGESTVIDLPPDVTFWRITGRTSTLDVIDVVRDNSSTNVQFVALNDTPPTGKKVTYRLQPPRE